MEFLIQTQPTDIQLTPDFSPIPLASLLLYLLGISLCGNSFIFALTFF